MLLKSGCVLPWNLCPGVIILKLQRTFLLMSSSLRQTQKNSPRDSTVTWDQNSNGCVYNIEKSIYKKVKVKQSRYAPWRRLGGEEVWLLLILDLGTRWEWVVSVTPLPRFYSRGKDPRYPLYRRLGGPQSRSGHRGQRKNPLLLPGIEPRSPGRPVRSQTLYCLS
jgi:hypothetical protein